MRVPAPPSQKLSAELLLRDVRARLAERMPFGDLGDPDPTDPAWLLLEQAAWMVERLSDQLDQYPFAALQQTFHLLGAELQPAQPALGVVALVAAEDGVLRHKPGQPDQTRFFSAQSERSSALEFVLVEPELHLCRVALRSMCLLDPDDGLTAIAPISMEDDLGDVATRPGAGRPSVLFESEELQYRVLTLAVDDTLAALQQAAKALLLQRGVSWLDLTVSPDGPGAVRLTARVSPERAVIEAAGETPLVGGDLTLRWGRLNDTDWTPPVCLGELPELPPARRGRPVPHRGQRDTLTLLDLPAGVLPARLLRRAPQPIPSSVVGAIWRTLAALDHARLGALHPAVSVHLSGGPQEPSWVEGAIRAKLWEELEGEAALAVELGLSPSDAPRTIRLAISTPGREADVAGRLRAISLDEGGASAATLPAPRLAWELPLPDDDPERGWRLVTAVDLTLPAGAGRVVLLAPPNTLAVLVNAALVAQAPAVRDGRQWTVQRNVPEAITLLHPDVISPAGLARHGDWSLPPSTTARLRALPLAMLDVEGELPSADWAGVALDGSAGQLTLNAPDERGVTRPLRPRQRVTMRWYRRTDGRWGNLPAGAITYVEQEPSARPKVAAVRNPLPTFHGEDREAPEQAIERLFASQSALPVLPEDFERLVRQVLGRRAPGWEVRCWTYLERTLFPWALWPLPEAEAADEETRAQAEALRALGPEQVVIALGPRDGAVSGESVEGAHREVARAIHELSRRVPRLRGSLLLRLWPLTATLAAGEAAPALPSHGAEGRAIAARDERGRAAVVPRDVQLLNAAIVRVTAAGVT